jgi:hypothetical protein
MTQTTNQNNYATDAGSEPVIEITTSARATKGAYARYRNGRYIITVPASWSQPRHDEAVAGLITKIKAAQARKTGAHGDLTARAAALADTYVDGVRPASITWVTNQNVTRWASCTTQTRQIRLSHRLQCCPTWVQDAVIVHELTHLVEANHSPRFHAIANRYPRQQEAHTFLAGYHLGLHNPLS